LKRTRASNGACIREALSLLAIHLKADPTYTYIPAKNATSRRWHARTPYAPVHGHYVSVWSWLHTQLA
jgi:hypothetical protein